VSLADGIDTPEVSSRASGIPSSRDAVVAEGRGATFGIAVAVGVGSMSFNFWYPFMPLYLLDIGARDEADALFWVAVATTIQGVARIATGPVWGVLSDRMGRKLMLLRALYLATPTTLIAAFASEPWHISIALAFQGLFSGFIPAAVALTTVTVPEGRMNSSLSLITGTQYIGTTVGPAVGAVLAAALGFRGAILAAAFLPALAATLVLLTVPNDLARQVRVSRGSEEPLEPFKPTRQLALVIFVFFVVFALTQLIRLVTPIALHELHEGGVAGITGLAFTLAGLASALAVLFVAPNFFRAGRQRPALMTACLVAGICYLALAGAQSTAAFVLLFVTISLIQAAMVPAINTLIAANAPRSRRGTAFGWAGSAQALAFVVGPMGAALFAAVSLDLGFAVLAAVLAGMAALLLTLREPAV
jgi:DHA1 family multidrug resistance protein-like MFS transporter